MKSSMSSNTMSLFLLLLSANSFLVSRSFVLNPSTTGSKIQIGHAIPTTSTASITNYMLDNSLTRNIPQSPLSLHATTEREARNETRNANNYDSTQQKSKKKDFTEVSRLRFMLNQLKGNMQESEMRAGAAERRVAMLQKQIQDNLQAQGEGQAPTNNGGDGDANRATTTATMSAEEKAQQEEMKKENEMFLNQVKSLKGTIKQINKAMENFKKETEQKMADMNTANEKERIEWKKQTDALQGELTTANDELKTARKESDHLGAEIKALEMHMEIKEQELIEESERKLEEAKSQAQKVQYSLEVEKELLKEKLVASKDRTDELLKDLEMTKIDMTQELITVKTDAEKQLEKAKKDLDIKAQDISVKKETIKMLVGERQSIRKLFRVQRYLIKARVKSRIGRIMGKSEE